MNEDEVSRGRALEEERWADWEFERERRKFARQVHVACGTLLAIVMGFNAWLVWLIWLSR